MPRHGARTPSSAGLASGLLLLLLLLLGGCGAQPGRPEAQGPGDGSTPVVVAAGARAAPVPVSELRVTLPGRLETEPPPDVGWVVQAWSDGEPPGAVQQVFTDDLGLELPQSDWRQSDLDGDGHPEWIGVVRGAGCTSDPKLWLVGLDGRIVEHDVCAPHGGCEQSCEVLATRDLTGDGLDDVVVRSVVGGAHTETMLYRVVSGHGGERPRNVVLAPPSEAALTLDAAEMTYARESIEDATGDGVDDLVVTGGLIGSAGAGSHQRERREVWGWDGTQVTLLESQRAPTDLRLFVLYDANEAMAGGESERAAQLYAQVVESAALRDVDSDLGEPTGPAVRQFAAFRLALLALERGDADGAQAWLGWLESFDSSSAYTRAARRLVDAWSGSREEACTLVTATLRVEKVDWRPLSDMGYANPALDADDLCPAP